MEFENLFEKANYIIDVLNKRKNEELKNYIIEEIKKDGKCNIARYTIYQNLSNTRKIIKN